MKNFIYLFSMVSILSFNCTGQKQKVDLLVINAKVYSVDENFNVFESFAIQDGKFVAVGTNSQIEEAYTSDSILDLNGKPVYPGLYDAHCHFVGYGLGLSEANLVGTNSFDEIIDLIKKHSIEHTEEWVIGRGWDQNDWALKDLPENTKLNEAFPNKPVVLTRVDGHALIANDEALKRAGITVQSKISGGEIIKKNGKLTGILIDNAMSLMNRVIPLPDKDTKLKAILNAQKNCFSVGLTTVCDAGLDYDVVELLIELSRAKQLKMHVYAMLSPSKKNLENFVKKGPVISDGINIRCIKLYADGALGSRGACLLKPYADDPGNKGLIVEDINTLKDIYLAAYNYNFQVATHAIGDSANRLVLNLYGEILKDRNDRRWRIEHAQVVDKNDFSLFKKFSVIPSVQPTHATSDMYWAGNRLGPERIKFAYAYKSLLETNSWIPLGSDFPVEDINPLFGFYAAVSRMDQKFFPERGFQSEQALTKQEALRGMTIWAAKSCFEENEKGSIEPGKLADFVILDKDIMEVDIKEIPKVKVQATYIGGEKVY